MIVRYQDRYYEFRADARIEKLRSHLEYDTVAIFVGSLFIFDAHTDQNIAKLKLKGDANNTLVYLQNTQEYFLLAVYEDMWLDIFTVKYLKEQGLRTIVQINRQEIDLQPNDKINKNYRIKHIYI